MAPMFRWFENLIEPFPETRQGPPPRKLWAFAWHYMWDARWAVFGMALLSAAIAVGEVLLFGFLGQIVDWLSAADRESFLEDEGRFFVIAGLLVAFGLPLLNFLSGLLMHQSLLGNTPMSARWRMHRYLLGQSMTFFANEFAGRVSTKVMQSALAVREMVMKVMDIFVYVAVYFITMVALIASADLRLAIPLAIWLAVYAGLIWYYVPRLATISEKQADARSAMTGRIVDSYTNIATIKLFSHARREEAYAKEGMRAFLDTVHPQMRLVTSFHSILYFNNCLLIVSIGALGISLWLQELISVGAIAVAVALALRVNGMSQWIMWEVSGLFENIGVAYDGISMMSKPRQVEDAPDARPLLVPNGDIAFETVSFHYGKDSGVIDDLSLTVAPGERVGLVGRSGAGKSTIVNLLLRLYDVEGGRITIGGTPIDHLQLDALRAAGCSEAMVSTRARLVEMLSRLMPEGGGDELERTQALDAEELVIACQLGFFAREVPRCDAIARAYGAAVENPPRRFFVVVVQGSSEKCSGSYAPDGSLLEPGLAEDGPPANPAP